jgi:hypothetical protein
MDTPEITLAIFYLFNTMQMPSIACCVRWPL